MTDCRRPKRTLVHVNRLQQLLQCYSRATGVAPNRLPHWLTMMVMTGALDRVQADPEQPLFLVKGGVAMESRLRQGARATRDLDMVFLGDPDQLLAALDAALAEPYSLFSLERRPPEPIGSTGSQRVEVKVSSTGALGRRCGWRSHHRRVPPAARRRSSMRSASRTSAWSVPKR